MAGLDPAIHELFPYRVAEVVPIDIACLASRRWSLSLRYSQKEILLLRVVAIGLLAVALSPYLLVKSYPYMKVLAVVVGVLAITSVLVVSRRVGEKSKIEPTQQSQKAGDFLRQSFVRGTILLCLSAIMFLSFGVRAVYGPALPEAAIIPPLLLAAIGLAFLLHALRKRNATNQLTVQ